VFIVVEVAVPIVIRRDSELVSIYNVTRNACSDLLRNLICANW